MGEPCPDLVIIPFRLGPFWNFAYLAGSRASGAAIVIDPGWDVPAIIARAATEGLRITLAAVTHHHHDHAHGLDDIVRTTGAEVLVHHRDAHALRDHYRGPVSATSHDETRALGGHRVRLLHTPGHTPGSQCIEIGGGALFTGDTLMVGSLGRAGAEPDAAQAMWRTVSEKLALLPDELVIYPGHDYGPRPSSTLGYERRTIAHLAAASFEEFQGLR